MNFFHVYFLSCNLTAFIGCNCFLGESLGASTYKTMSCANQRDFSSSLPTWHPLYFSRMAQATVSNTLLNQTEESEHPCLAPDFAGNDFSPSLFGVILAVACPTQALFLVFWGIRKGCWTPLNASSASKAMVIWFLCFVLLTGCSPGLDWAMLSHPRIPRTTPYYTVVYRLFSRAAGFDLLALCWECLHLCSSGILVHGFLFFKRSCPCIILMSGSWWLPSYL